jgi:hypothetical protein
LTRLFGISENRPAPEGEYAGGLLKTGFPVILNQGQDLEPAEPPVAIAKLIFLSFSIIQGFQ